MLKFGPREAWEMTGLLRLSQGPFKASTFYLDPNEMASNNTSDRIGGADLRWDGEYGGYAGLSPQAAPGGVGPPNFITGGREGLNTLNFYGRSEPFSGRLADLAVSLDLAYQWNDEVDLRAWGGCIKAEYPFEDTSWRPVLGYSYQIFMRLPCNWTGAFTNIVINH